MAGQVLPASLLDKGLPAGEWVLIPVQAVLSAEMARPKGVSKATIQRCISKLSPYWSDEQLDQVVEMFQAHGLL